jgi:hypothetical protein
MSDGDANRSAGPDLSMGDYAHVDWRVSGTPRFYAIIGENAVFLSQ